jgi:hypothetical protein
MQNLYGLRKKWAAVYCDSFTTDIRTTQKSEGMNNVFKKRFCRKLGLSELIVHMMHSVLEILYCVYIYLSTAPNCSSGAKFGYAKICPAAVSSQVVIRFSVSCEGSVVSNEQYAISD